MKIQSALEYLLVSGFVLIVVVIGFSFALKESLSQVSELNLRQIDINVQKIMFYSELVNSQGEPAKYSMILNFPLKTRIFNISNTIVIEYLNNRIAYPFKFKVYVNETFFGQEKIEIKAEKNYVKIEKK